MYLGSVGHLAVCSGWSLGGSWGSLVPCPQSLEGCRSNIRPKAGAQRSESSYGPDFLRWSSICWLVASLADVSEPGSARWDGNVKARRYSSRQSPRFRAPALVAQDSGSDLLDVHRSAKGGGSERPASTGKLAPSARAPQESASSRRALQVARSLAESAPGMVFVPKTNILGADSDERRCSLHRAMRRSWLLGSEALRPDPQRGARTHDGWGAPTCLWTPASRPLPPPRLFRMQSIDAVRHIVAGRIIDWPSGRPLPLGRLAKLTLPRTPPQSCGPRDGWVRHVR